MKRITGFLLVVLSAWVPAAASPRDVTFLARGGFFRPADAMYGQIYGGGPAFSFEIDLSLSKHIDIWAEAGYFSQTGSLTLTGEPTRIWSLPGGAGLRFVLPVGRLRIYAGAGAGYFKLVEENRIGTFISGRLGGILRAGLSLGTRSGLAFDAAVSYSSCRMQSEAFAFGAGGLAAGLGVGYSLPGSSLRRVQGGRARTDFSLSAGVTSGRSTYSWHEHGLLWFGATLDLRLAKSLTISPEIVSIPEGFVTVAPGVLVNYEFGPAFVGGGLSLPVVMSGADNPGDERIIPKFNFGLRFGHIRIALTFLLKSGALAPGIGIGYQGIRRIAI